ncbi:hypothetical protein Glove_384g62 [Diversispora epigaea]|uniref:Uncharacterized protein n=1 Tax=Diversispora epigaea TaxID=1348612 RepID=A0A397H3R6_9GLOM|nr:hypothetical protein Glove_384g62 [Diversispora epigaea]
MLYKTILEIGAGTSLPGFLCASLSPETQVILTDRSDSPQILENIREGSKLNGFLINSSSSSNINHATSSNEVIINSNVWIRGLKWGCFDDDDDDGDDDDDDCDDDDQEEEKDDDEDDENDENFRQKSEKGSGLFKLLRDIEQLGRKLDWILGSDTFYDPKDFQDIIVTIAYILTFHSPNAKFLTSYQERSSKRSIQHLLDKWNLKSRQIPLKSFNFNYDKYINLDNFEEDDDDGDYYYDKECEDSEDSKEEDLSDLNKDNSLSSSFLEEENNDNYFSKSHNSSGGDSGSKKYSSSLQNKWNLKSRQIPLKSFNFNYDKYINLDNFEEDDDDGDYYYDKECEDSEDSKEEDLSDLNKDNSLSSSFLEEENNDNYFSKSHNSSGGDSGSKKYSSSLQSIFLLEIWKI